MLLLLLLSNKTDATFIALFLLQHTAQPTPLRYFAELVSRHLGKKVVILFCLAFSTALSSPSILILHYTQKAASYIRVLILIFKLKSLNDRSFLGHHYHIAHGLILPGRREDFFRNNAFSIFNLYDQTIAQELLTPGVMKCTILVYLSLVMFTLYLVCLIYALEQRRKFKKKQNAFLLYDL